LKKEKKESEEGKETTEKKSFFRNSERNWKNQRVKNPEKERLE